MMDLIIVVVVLLLVIIIILVIVIVTLLVSLSCLSRSDSSHFVEMECSGFDEEMIFDIVLSGLVPMLV